MNEYFEDAHHSKSLIPNPERKVGRPSLKSKVKEELYRTTDITDLFLEFKRIDWGLMKTLRKASKKPGARCSYCNMNLATTKEHFISQFHRRCAIQQEKEIRSLFKILIRSCPSCNTKKGDLLPSDWLKEINMKQSRGNESIDIYYRNIKITLEKILKITDRNLSAYTW